MTTPPMPANESTRLASLHNLQVLDTPIEDRYERITRLAQRIFGTEIAAISLVESDRQWFKSVQGLNASETERRHSFCAYGLHQDELLIVEDAREDPRFANNPFVTGDPEIVFYAGAQVHAPNGACLGMLCVIHPEKREFSDEDRQILRDLAGIVSDELARHAAPVGSAWTDRKDLLDSVTRVWSDAGIARVAQCVMNTQVPFGRAVVCIHADGVEDIGREHGEPIADEILRQIARRLTTIVRETDSIGRVGGSRFVMTVTPCPSPEVASNIGAMARALVGQTPIQTSAGRFTINVRTGVRAADQHEHVDGAIAIADAESAMLASPEMPARAA